MKHCKRSHKCPYGNAFEKNVCAYDKNLNEDDACPYLLENWDSIINELIKEKNGDNNAEQE